MRKRTHRFFFFRVLDPPPFKIGGCDVKEKKKQGVDPNSFTVKKRKRHIDERELRYSFFQPFL